MLLRDLFSVQWKELISSCYCSTSMLSWDLVDRDMSRRVFDRFLRGLSPFLEELLMLLFFIVDDFFKVTLSSMKPLSVIHAFHLVKYLIMSSVALPRILPSKNMVLFTHTILLTARRTHRSTVSEVDKTVHVSSW